MLGDKVIDQPSGWIDAGHKWPEERQDVLLYAAGKIWLVHRLGNQWIDDRCSTDIRRGEFWMMLPEPPKL
jgi:hypothetical protein